MLDRLGAPIGVAVVVAALAFAGFQWANAKTFEARAQRVVADFSSYRAAQEQSAREALQRAAVEKAHSDKVRQEALDAENLARVAAEADARRADAAAGQLRRHATDLAASLRAASGADPALAARSEAASATADLLAELLDRVDSAAGEVGRYADQARRAGQLCTASYEALTPP